MGGEYFAFKKDGTSLTKTDINLIQKKFSLEGISGEDGKKIFPFNLDDEVLGDIIHSPFETIVEFYEEFYGEDEVRIKGRFKSKYGWNLE